MDTTIGILGLGFVGDALKFGLESGGISNIVFYDPKRVESKFENVVATDICFICVPTPMDSGGIIDDSIVDTVLGRLSEEQYSGVVAIKSTLLPTSVTKFRQKFSNLRIVTNPEFLTERRARQDFINAEWVLIGGDKLDAVVLEKLYKYIYRKSQQHVAYAIVSAEAAMMAKYMTNTWFSVKVSLMNEFRELWDALHDGDQSDWEELVNAFSLDKRVGPTHLQVPGPDGDRGFGGRCFPKDLNALMSLAKINETSHRVMLAAWQDNLCYRKNKDWLTIDGAVTSSYVQE